MALQASFKRLLVVEDDPDQSRALRDRLQLYGYAVACADDGDAAMKMLQTHAFHGLLLDLNLPTVPGTQILTEARQVFPALPVLIMSASQSRIRAAKASQAGACSYILKPFGIAELKHALHSCFGPAEEVLAS